MEGSIDGRNIARVAANWNLRYSTGMLALFVAMAVGVDRPPVRLDVPVVDLPFDVRGYPLGNPSMAQSLAVTFDLAQVVHGGVLRLSDRYQAPIPRLAIRIGIGLPLELLVDVVGVAWMHEEWHRSVLARF